MNYLNRVASQTATSTRLNKFARRFGTGIERQHYTWRLANGIANQKAFDDYRSARMDHKTISPERLNHDSPWMQIDGFITADQLLTGLQSVASNRQSVVSWETS